MRNLLAREHETTGEPSDVALSRPEGALVSLIDDALVQFAGRGVVRASEVLDALLDLRLAAVVEETLSALLP